MAKTHLGLSFPSFYIEKEVPSTMARVGLTLAGFQLPTSVSITQGLKTCTSPNPGWPGEAGSGVLMPPVFANTSS